MGCSYATVIQIKGWLPPAVGAVCWFAFDNPALSPRIPILLEQPNSLPALRSVPSTAIVKIQQPGSSGGPTAWLV